jgi:hypothetical protein
MKATIRTVELAPGPLFEHWDDEGELRLFYNIDTVAILPDGRRFTHSFSPFGFGATGRAEAFAARVRERGTIDLEFWHEVHEGPSLEERLGPFGTEWMAEHNNRSMA